MPHDVELSGSPDDPRAWQAQLELTQAHRIVRRGRMYGEPFDPAFDPDRLRDADDKERGLHFLCFNANLSRQFEFVQSNWAMNPTFAGLSRDPDPLLGARRACPFPAADFTMPGSPTRRIHDLPRVVEVRGAGYFFMPSRAALEYLATAAILTPPETRIEMKLYFSPGACSLHPHITAREAGLPIELVRVDLRAHKTQDGGDYYAVNPKGYVPALQLDDGTILTEGAVIDQYLADQKPEARLIPVVGTLERYRVQEWLNFIASEIHKAFGPLFGGSDEAKEQARARVSKRLDLVARTLDAHPYLMGDSFGVADAYLFNMLTWTAHTGIDLAKWPSLQAFFARVKQRPAVQAALAAEKG